MAKADSSTAAILNIFFQMAKCLLCSLGCKGTVEIPPSRTADPQTQEYLDLRLDREQIEELEAILPEEEPQEM
jgi:hypothetical protein